MKFTQLVSQDIGNIRKANRIFGSRSDDGQVPLVLRPGSRSSVLLPFTIPEGMYALVQSSGKDIPHSSGSCVWPAGCHWDPNPFVQVKHLVTKQHIVFNTPVKGCKTSDNVTVQIDMTLVFRIMGDANRGEDPELVKTFVYNMGPSSLTQQLADAQEEAARQLARSVTHDEVYNLRSSPLREDLENVNIDDKSEAENLKTDQGDDNDNDNDNDDDDDDFHSEKVDPKILKMKRLNAIRQTENIRQNLNDQFNQYGVMITNVNITDVILPSSFIQQMQEKTTYTSIMEAEKMKQKNDMQLLKYNEELEQTQQLKNEEKMAEQSRGIQQQAMAQKEFDQVTAETRKMVSILEEKQKTMLREKAATLELKVANLVLDKENILKKLDAEAKAESHRLRVSLKVKEEKLMAEAKLKIAKNKCMAEKLIGEAQGYAAKKLESKRKHDRMKEQLKIYESLADNKSVVYSGVSSKNNNLLANILVANRETKILLNETNLMNKDEKVIVGNV